MSSIWSRSQRSKRKSRSLHLPQPTRMATVCLQRDNKTSLWTTGSCSGDHPPTIFSSRFSKTLRGQKYCWPLTSREQRWFTYWCRWATSESWRSSESLRRVSLMDALAGGTSGSLSATFLRYSMSDSLLRESSILNKFSDLFSKIAKARWLLLAAIIL